MSLPVFAIQSFADMSLEKRIEALRVQVSEIIHSISDEYDPTKTYTAGQLVTHEGKLYKALVNITIPEAWNPEHWEERDIEDEITRLTNEIASKYTKPEDGIPLTDLVQAIRDSLALADSSVQPEDIDDMATQTWVSQKVQAVRDDVTGIAAVIPSDATAQNKLVSASQMGDAISLVEAKQLYATASQGSFATKAELTGATTYYNADGTVATPTKNDVAYVLADESHGGRSAKYVIAQVDGSTITWGFVITFSDTTFTQAQMNAINSGATQGKVSSYDTHIADNDIHVTATQKESWNGKQDAISDLDSIRSDASAGATAYQKPSSGIPDTDLDNGVKASLDRANSAALPDGYYGESGGVYQYSTNFLGKNAPSNANDLVFRPTASNFSGQEWSADSLGGQTATIEKIKGKTLVWNQQRKAINSNNIATPRATDVVFSNGECTFTALNDSIVIHNAPTTDPSLAIIANHKYLTIVDVKAAQGAKLLLYVDGGVGNLSIPDVADNSYHRYFCLYNENSSFIPSTSFGIRDHSEIHNPISFKNLMRFDLTKMFGAGNEPATVEEFRAMFPLDYYEYNAGELVSFNGTGLQTTGFNQFDSSDYRYISGDFDQGKIHAYARDRRIVYIPCLPNVKYTASRKAVTSNERFWIAYTKELPAVGSDIYDIHRASNSQAIGNMMSISTTTSIDAKYIVVWAYWDNHIEALDDLCINLSWSGIRDGEYEPYWQSQLALPIATYFPDGMKSAGTVYDELTKDKAITRIGFHIIAEDEIGINSPGTYTRYAYIPKQSNDAGRFSGESNKKYTNSAGFKHTFYGNTDSEARIGEWLSAVSTGFIYICFNASATDAYIKSILVGSSYTYLLADAVETPISPELNLTYRCDDFGTEMLLPQNTDEPVTAPMDAEITYQLDYEAQIRNMDSLVITKKSMDSFIPAFNNSGIGTITQTWNATTKSYDYTVAKSSCAAKIATALPSDGILVNNTEYRLGTISALTINGFADGPEGFVEDWAVVFTADTGIAVTLPNTITWSVATPVFEAGKTYYLSFVHIGNGYIGVWGVM